MGTVGTIMSHGAKIEEEAQDTTCWCMLPVCDGNHGTTPEENLDQAARIGNVQAMKSLLDKGKNANGSDVNTRAPLIWALEGGHAKATELLLERNADANLRSFPEGSPPLYQAVQSNAEVVEILLRHNANADVQDHAGDTPLHRAVRLGKIKIVEVLLKHGADCNVQNNVRSRTPLHLSTMRGLSNIMKLLIQYNASLDIQDIDGNTALHFAALFVRNNSSIIFNQLLNSNASSVTLNHDHMLPIHCAMEVRNSTHKQSPLYKNIQQAISLLDEKRILEVDQVFKEATQLPADITVLIAQFTTIYEHDRRVFEVDKSS